MKQTRKIIGLFTGILFNAFLGAMLALFLGVPPLWIASGFVIAGLVMPKMSGGRLCEVVIVGSGYAGEVLDKLLIKATTGNELVAGGHIRIEPNIKYKFTLPRLRAGKMLQKRKEQPTDTDSKGNFTYDEKYLEPKEFMAFTTFNPRSFERVWRKWQPTGPLVFSQLPPEGQNALLEELAKVVDFELGDHFVNGKYGSTDEELFDGILTSIKADADVGEVAAPEPITSDNVITKLAAVRNLVPAAVRKQGNVKIFMSIDDGDLYDDALANRQFKGKDYTDKNLERYKGIPIITLASWPKDVIVIANASTELDTNFWGGVSYSEDADVIQIDKLTNAGEKYFFKMLMKADTEVAFGDEIVLYDGRVEEGAAPVAPQSASSKSAEKETANK
ncbi:MAG: hypothetical protein ACK5JS_07320 [Mangrovibacterium sp.]